MGIFTDYLANTKSVDTVLPKAGIGRAVTQELQAQLSRNDPALGGSYAAADAVHTLAELAVDPTAATFILTFRLNGLKEVRTAAIAHDASAATIETAINVAMTAAAIPGWTNGDISVAATSTNLEGGTVTLTFDGASVDDLAHGLTTIETSAEFFDDPAVDETTPGNESDTAEVQTIAQFVNVPTGGTWDLIFTGLIPATGDPISFTVSDIPFDATGAEVEILVDAAAVAAGNAGWSGEIAVTDSATDLTDGTIILTYGAGLLEEFANQPLAEVDGTDLIGAYLDDPASEITTNGSSTREALQILFATGTIKGTVPAAGETPVDFTAGNRGTPWSFSADAIRALARDAGIADHNDGLQAAILAAHGLA